MAKIVVLGLKHLDKKLNKLGSVVANKVVIKSMRDAMKPLVPAVKATAPVGETGHLAASPKTRAGKRKQNSKSIIVYVDKDKFTGGDPINSPKETFYAVVQEFGSRFQPGKGFMRKVYDSNQDSARKRAMDGIAQGIEAAIKAV